MRDAWIENARIVQLPLEDEFAQEVAPVLAWIEDEDRKQELDGDYWRAVQDLEQGLNSGSLGAADLRQLANAVENFGRGMPDRLGLRFRTRLSDVSSVETRRKGLRLGGIVCGILAIVAVVVVGLHFANKAAMSSQLLAEVEDLIEELRLDEANELLTVHSTDAVSEAAMQVKKKLTDAIQAEHDRKTQLAAALELAKGNNDPAQSEAALKRARSLARGTEEKGAVGKLETEWTNRRDAAVAENDRQFRELITSTTGQLVELERLPLTPNSVAAMQRLSDSVERALVALQSLGAKVAPDLASQTKPLEGRFAVIQKSRADATKKDQLLAALTRLILIPPSDEAAEIHVSEYRDTLAQFVQLFPEDVRSKGFQSAGNVEVIQATFLRQKQMTVWKHFLPSDATEIETRSQECTQFLTDYPATPDRDVIVPYQLFLKSLLWRENGDEESDQSVKSRMRTLFSGKLVKEGHMLRTANGTCYYLEKEKDLKGDEKANFKYLIGFNGETEQVKDLDVASLVSPKTAPPPQSKLADHVWETVSDVKSENWDPYMRDVCVSLLSAKDIDPFLRYFLLLRTLEFSSQGNSLLARELQSCLKELSDSQMDLTVSWMNPKDSAARTSRQLAIVLIRHAEGVDDAWTRAAKAQQKLTANLFRKMWPVGWIERGKDYKWTLRTNWSVDQRHELFCAAASADGTKRQWQDLGTFQGTAAELRVPANSGLLEGTVVFATHQSKDVLSASDR